MPAERRKRQSRRLTVAGLITVSAATVLMAAWVIFPAAAFASTQQTTWNHVNGAGFVPCAGTTFWILTGFGNDADGVSNVSIVVNGGSAITMQPQGNNFRANVPGPNTSAQATSAVATWTWDDSGPVPTPVLTISHCTAGSTTTSTTSPPSSTTETTTTETTTTETTTTETTTSETTTPGTTTSETTTPGTTTSQTETTSTTGTTVSGTTVTPPGSSSTPPQGTTVLPTTVTPGGTAFTGIENVVPLGAVALLLMTGGSGLMWAGARRRRGEDGEDEE
jgi:hypothetical protein